MPIICPRRINSQLLPQARDPVIRNLLGKPSVGCMYSGRLYPSGAFTLGAVPPLKRTIKDIRYHEEARTWRCNKEFRYDLGDDREVIYTRFKSRDLNRFIEAPYLGKTRKRRGSHGLTRHGRRYINESCGILERMYGIGHLGFYTTTIPTCSVDEARLVALSWAKIYKYFFKLLRNEITRQTQSPIHYVGVVENQSQRSAGADVPYYHLHFVMPCHVSGTTKFIVSADTIRSLWRRAITNYVPSLGGASFSASVDSQVLRKSASGYLSKYFSKGGGIVGVSPDLLVPSWYYSSRELKALYKSECTPIGSEMAQYIFDVSDVPEFIICISPVYTTSDRCPSGVLRGYWGIASDMFREFLASM